MLSRWHRRGGRYNVNARTSVFLSVSWRRQKGHRHSTVEFGTRRVPRSTPRERWYTTVAEVARQHDRAEGPRNGERNRVGSTLTDRGRTHKMECTRTEIRRDRNRDRAWVCARALGIGLGLSGSKPIQGKRPLYPASFVPPRRTAPTGWYNLCLLSSSLCFFIPYIPASLSPIFLSRPWCWFSSLL